MKEDSKTERRFIEFRAEGDTLSGPLIVYGDRARFGDWTETFEPGSLRHDDVIANLQHDRGKPVVRSGAGLTLTDGPQSLQAHLTLPDTVYGREARELVSARILRGFSVEFRATKETWDQARKERRIEEADLVGFALVDRPAYPASVIAQRFEEHHGAPAPRPRRRKV